MGSEIMTTTVEQKGQISTNPGGGSPSTSRPIQQRNPTPSTATPSTPVQQRLSLATGNVGAEETSKPVEQKEGDSFNKDGTRPDDCFLEQKNIERDDAGPDSPIEQQIFVTNNLRDATTGLSQMEQRVTSRASTGSDPVQQDAKKSNTIDLTQFNFAELVFPQCNSIKNPVTTNILWRVRDFGFLFDVETLIFTVNGFPVQDSSNFTVTAIVGGLQLDFDPPDPFDFGSTVTVILSISDNASPPNNFLYRCSWDTVEDSRPPVISLLSPLCDATNVDVREPVVFSVLDLGEGITQDSIKFSIEGIPVCSGLTFDSITTSSGSGFTVTWDHTSEPFRFDSSVSVGITATDLAEISNSSSFVCCFQTEESSVPEFLYFGPLQCGTFVDNTTGLCFEVYGDIDGIDICTLEVRIDNKLRKVLVRPRILRSE